jgi:hypothetical protein
MKRKPLAVDDDRKNLLGKREHVGMGIPRG